MNHQLSKTYCILLDLFRTMLAYFIYVASCILLVYIVLIMILLLFMFALKQIIWFWGCSMGQSKMLISSEGESVVSDWVSSAETLIQPT